MPRIARVVIPGIPHHITQRGNRRQRTFFEESDYRAYIALMAEFTNLHKVKILAYCLMPNHVHMVAVPDAAHGLRLAIGKAHKHYTSKVNARQEWTGHLWQGRFASFPLDEDHCIRALRYVEFNPVRAGIVEQAEDYPWSSAKARSLNQEDPLVGSDSFLELSGPLDQRGEIYDPRPIREHERSGRPLGSPEFISGLEKTTRRLLTKRSGRRPQSNSK